jgi:hypothetical protein
MTSFQNIDLAKSYATEENLTRALDRLNFTSLRPMVVRNREGRFTAIFNAEELRREGRWTCETADAGFKTFG